MIDSPEDDHRPEPMPAFLDNLPSVPEEKPVAEKLLELEQQMLDFQELLADHRIKRLQQEPTEEAEQYAEEELLPGAQTINAQPRINIHHYPPTIHLPQGKASRPWPRLSFEFGARNFGFKIFIE